MMKYDDIIKLNRPVSNHAKLSMEKRAAQFSPFAALTGYYDKILECTKENVKKKNLSYDELNEINTKLQYLIKNVKIKPLISITYFKKDEKQKGGTYKNFEGVVRRVDNVYKYIEFMDKTKIEIENILDIKGEIFKNIDTSF